jgi:amino acid transporter
VRLLHTMGRERLLPARLGSLNPKRHTPVFAIFFEAIFTIGVAILVGLVSGGLTNPVGGSNVYGYLGFALTLAILPVYALTNIATIRYFAGKPNFNPVRHVVLPGFGAVLMIALLVGQIIENPTPPYNWMPYGLVAWAVIVAGVAFWLGRVRPRTLELAGAILGTGEAAEEAQPARAGA